MTWHTGPLVLFDLETTGVDPHRDRIVTAAIIEVATGGEKRCHDWLLDPGIDIPEGAAEIHGITTTRAREDGMAAAGAIFEIGQTLQGITALGVPVVGHNVSYDLTMLWCELMRHGGKDLAKLVHRAWVIDTLVLDKWADPYRKGSRRLVDVARHYGVDLAEQDAHGAEADALAAGRIAWMLANRWPNLADMPLGQLHAAQVAWKREQADSFGRYLVKRGKVDDVAREWPLVPPPAGWSPEQLPVAERVPA